MAKTLLRLTLPTLVMVLASTAMLRGQVCPASNEVVIDVVADPTVSITGAVTICSGGTATLNATAAGGSGTCTLQWQSSPDGSTGWANISGATATAYTTPALTATTHYRATYGCTGLGCDPAVSNTQAVTVVADPTIGTQPTGGSLCAGGSVTMTVAATGGTPSLTYQWQYNNGGTWANVVNATPTGSTYTGATGTSLTVAGISAAGSYQYRVLVNASGNGCTQAVSSTATVSVSQDLAITTQPQNITECIGGTDQHTVVVANGFGTITYQWQSSPNNTTWTNISGATNASYAPPSTTAGMTYYRVIASASGNGCDPATSNAATATIVADPVATISGATTICSGGTAPLTSTYTGGTGTPTYQWQSSPDGTTWTNISGATAANYTTAALTATTQYRVQLTFAASGCGTATSNAQTITVQPNPVATISGATTICSGGTAPLTSTYTGGTGTPTYQWQSSPDGTTWANISGATAANYTTAALTATTQYRVQLTFASSGCGTVTSNTQTITVVADPVATISGATTICSGGTAPLTSTYTGGTGTPTYQWQSSPDGTTWANISGATAANYTTAALTATTQYRVQLTFAASGCGTATSNAQTITVQPDPVATISGATTICSGGTAPLTSTYTGGTGTPTYQWQSSPDGTTWANISGATAANYTTAALTATTQYRVQLTFAASGCGTATSNAQTITVQPNPVATISGATTICSGGTAPLTSTYTGGTGTPTYQWQSSPDGTTWTNISGATAANYTTAALTATTQYRVQLTFASSGCGTVTSNTQTITVVADPVATISGAATICSGGTAPLTSTYTGGTGTPTYQWQSSPDGTTWANISGATAANYTTAALTATTQYRVQLTFAASGCGTATSNAQTITVVADPSIGTQPTGGTICTGGSQALTVVATGGTPALAYQWQYNNGGTWANVVNGTPAGSTYTGSTAASMTVAGITAAGSYQYRVLVTATGNGCGQATSNAATVIVNQDLSITTQPQNINECVGGTDALSVAIANGAGSITYQWQSSANGTTGWANVSGATTTSYTPPSTTSGTTYYRVIISTSTSGCDAVVSDVATVVIAPDPTVSVTGVGQVCVGAQVTLNATTTGGAGSCYVQWQNSSDSGATWNDISGGVGPSYTTPTLTSTSRYRAIVICSGSGCCN